jgi:ATP-binding cassette subfamily B protein
MKFIPQHDLMDCGPACLSMIAIHYGKTYDIQYLRENTFMTREGVTLLGISQAAEKIGFSTLPAKLTLEKLIGLVISSQVSLPCIIHWNQNHFVVLRKISKSPFSRKYVFKLADPAYGFISLNQQKFEFSYLSGDEEGVALFLEPSTEFTELKVQKTRKPSISYLLNYLSPFKKQLIAMMLLLLIGSGINLTFPFLTQNLIDKGINYKDLNFITLILLAQLALFFGLITFEIIRNRIALKTGTKLSIRIIAGFLKKMLRLPIKFFESKMIGDLQQRIQDNERIENFITSQTILTAFSIITFSVYFGVLCYYDINILAIYLILTAIAVIWSFYWLRKRKIVDYFKFQEQSKNQSSIYELINGVSEMKLNQFEAYKCKEWEDIQQKLYKINLRLLKIDQFQHSGFEFFNQSKNIIVTFLAAYNVVIGQMTLGELMGISYIIGQMNSPVNQLVIFFRSLQDARLSLERLNEVQNNPDEEQPEQLPLNIYSPMQLKSVTKGITLYNVSFQYQGPLSPFVLKDIDLFIPEGKITAIVGTSGSGKTTLLKLLLKFFSPVEGTVLYNQDNINQLSAQSLRQNTGVVMQDGYIFSDTIERNIATGDEDIDPDKLRKATEVAYLDNFIDSLPLGYKTKIGTDGNGISGGQRQRILIARAVYKNPHYIFFDEATSSLDAESEKKIYDNLQRFFHGKTVIIIAHRLSTVKNADQIIVLKNGMITEKGTHQKLVSNQSEYFNLVRNQLELGE